VSVATARCVDLLDVVIESFPIGKSFSVFFHRFIISTVLWDKAHEFEFCIYSLFSKWYYSK
jgi:hypothetical protein